jgi:hypothetical protein
MDRWRAAEIKPDALSDAEIAVRLIFLFAVCVVKRMFPVSTVAEIKTYSQSLRDGAKRLHEVIVELEGLGVFIGRMFPQGDPPYDGAMEIIARCEEMADRADREIEDPFEFGNYPAIRDHGSRLEQAYCRRLTNEIGRLYGKQMRGVVAAITMVTLGRPVTKENVRYWTKGVK